MPLQTERPSLETTLEDRYKSQKCGGAFDAKSILTLSGKRMPIKSADGSGPAITETKWTNPDFLIKMPMQQTDFKDAIDGGESKQLSTMLRGFTNKKYKP